MSEAIPLAIPRLDGNESRYVQSCIDDNFVSSIGPFVARFEHDFAAAVGSHRAVACSTGTAALHTALYLVGVGPGDLVAVSSFTFIASANAVAYTGADVLSVDSEPRTWNIDGELLYDDVVRRSASGRRLPAAIEAVHVLGHPADLEPLIALRERFDIPIIEDAAEALGARYAKGPFAGRHVGTIGDVGCFSFNGNKIITTGGGGMLVTNDVEMAVKAKHLTTQAKLPGRGYRHDEVGFNYRLTNVAAALGVAQLERLDEFVAAKRTIATRYDEALADLPLQGPPSADWAEPSFWLYSALLEPAGPPRDDVLDALAAESVGARPLWPPLHQQAPYASAERIGGDVADDIFARGISLPSSTGLTSAQQERVIAAVRRALAGR